MAKLSSDQISSKVISAFKYPAIAGVALIVFSIAFPLPMKDADRDKIRDAGITALIGSAVSLGAGYQTEERSYDHLIEKKE